MTLFHQFLTNDKRIIHKAKHYFPIYERHFGRFINLPLTFIEIGVGEGGSLQMWKQYFGPFVQLVGIDINPACREFEEDQIAIRIGAQSDSSFLEAIIAEFGAPDIVLDDGSHQMRDVRETFQFLYPRLMPTGIYMVEDLQTAYWQEFGGGLRHPDSFIEFSKGLIDELNADHLRDHAGPTPFTRTTLSMHFYDGALVFERGRHWQQRAPKVGKGLAGEQRTDSSDQREEIDRRLALMRSRLGDPTLRLAELSDLHAQFSQVYPASPFPLIIEKRMLDLTLAAGPGQDHLRPRLREVNALLSGEFPLLAFDYDPARIDQSLIAEDAVEAALLALPEGKLQAEHAVAAFHRYIESGKPELFPAALAARAIRYHAMADAPAAPDATPVPGIPPVSQAEIYLGDDCIVIDNARTRRVVEHTRDTIGGRLQAVPHFPALLREIEPLVRGHRVFLAFGDSTTANIHNWPYRLYGSHLKSGDWIAINLADWARSSEQHAPVLDFFLDWLRDKKPEAIAVAVMLGLRDIHDRLNAYDAFSSGGCDTAALEGENQLREHRYGRQLARLLQTVPGDHQEIDIWIARRIFAGVRLMRRLCDDAGAQFTAILEPSAYEDCSPGYLRALRTKHQREGAAASDFTAWCREHRYVATPSWIGPRDHRPALDELRALWRGQSDQGMGPFYQDWSELFHDHGQCCFQEQFDAVHYNPTGSRIIADAVRDLLRPGAGNGRAAAAPQAGR